ncbi:MAG TPA: M20 family metallopeptidase [Candidatus Limnocylindrales bacterium]|jgi:glutamate carboxypeptidase
MTRATDPGPAAAGAGVTDAELDRLRSAVDDGLPTYLAELERYVNTDCGSYTRAGVVTVGRWAGSAFEQLGARVEYRPDAAGRFGDTVVATWERGRGDGPRVLLIGHLDTVFEEGTAAARPFRIDDGIATGPGVTDMKAGLLAGIHAIGALRALGPLPFARLVFIANPDEEVGSPTSTPHIRSFAAESDACLVLECARANGDIVSARKGTVDLTITVDGVAAHAGVEPEKGRSAILEAARIVLDLHALNGRWDGVTVNAGVIAGGTRPNVVAETCRIEADVRGRTAVELALAEDAIRALAAATTVPDTSVEIDWRPNFPPMEKRPASSLLVDHAIALAGRIGFALGDTATGGASDASSVSAMGVPTLDGLGPIGGNDHSPREYLEVDSVGPRTTLLAALLLAIARDPALGGRAAPSPG